MLIRLEALVIAATVLGTTTAFAQDEENDGIRRPERLTIGVADQFLGQLSPDKKTLYFASNRDTTNEIFSQNIEDGRAKILFDEGAEVTWPRISPDGKSLLYISFSERATGRLCVRTLPKGDNRRCLEGESSPVLAEWIDDGRILLVDRATIAGNLAALEVKDGKKLSSRKLLDRNMTSPAISPDGKWMVYVPLERMSERVGPAFAAHAAAHLEAIELARPEDPPRTLSPDLPGLMGQPSFAKDGSSLYFVQFFSDSNHDGVVDASDHGTVFRVGLKNQAFDGAPKQLSDEQLNCQYPAPATDRLLMTCSHGGNLDLYSLPLDGEVPAGWTAEHLQQEIELASTYPKLQLLTYERLTKSTTVSAQRFVMMRLVRLHLALEEFDAADHWAKHIAKLNDPDSAALAHPLTVLIDHRRALRERARGRVVEAFEERAQARLEALPVRENDESAGSTFSRVVRSEIADTMGDKVLARKELEAAPVAEKTARAVLEAYYERADALYRELDDREALVAACRRLALHPHLTDDERLRYARAAVRAMVRGLPYPEAEARLAKEPADGEIGFALELEKLLLEIRNAKPGPELKKNFIALYERETRVDRRRAIMLDTVARATQFGVDPIIEGLAEHYIDTVPPGSEERRRAERLYTQVIIGRAFRRRAATPPRLEEARADFEAVAKKTKSFEAIVAAIDLRMRAKETPAAIERDYAHEAPEIKDFVAAYLIDRNLRNLEGEAHAAAVKRASAHLMASYGILKRRAIAQSLFGAILHAEFLRTQDRALAERANTHYLVALELVGSNLRNKAMVLGQLGMLQTEVGNYRIGLGYLKDRDKLPYADNTEGFAVHLAIARDQLHIGKDKEAAKEADEALEMLDRQPKLAPYRLLALDRAALYNLAANHHERALALYDQEVPLLGQTGRKNQFVVRVAHAAAAVGAHEPARAMADLDQIDRELADVKFRETLSWPHSTNEQTISGYRLISTGLRGHAAVNLGRLDVAKRMLEERHAMIEAAMKKTDRGEYVRMLTLIESQQAENASLRHDEAGVNDAIGKALKHADNLQARDGGEQRELDKDGLVVLWLAAELAPGTPDVPARLQTTGEALSKLKSRKTPPLRDYERRFEVYETLTGPLVKE